MAPAKLKQINVRLSPTALDALATLKSHYRGLTMTGLFEMLVREAVAHLPPPKPFVMPSPEATEDERDDLQVARDRQSLAIQRKIENETSR